MSEVFPPSLPPWSLLLVEEVERGGVLGDAAVEQRLREHGLVQLVVPVAAVADHVDDAVLAPRL